ncbi:hypothetical protein [Streptomyces sp. NPDC051173]|uniref:hypothetical protein n=1 Tax=Streptomyces sp. NPDC051173 TaxID=3155164 RepID=UPI00344CE396
MSTRNPQTVTLPARSWRAIRTWAKPAASETEELFTRDRAARRRAEADLAWLASAWNIPRTVRR